MSPTSSRNLQTRWDFSACLLSSVGRALDFWAGSSDGSSGGLKIRRSVVQSHSGPPNQGVPSSNLGGDTSLYHWCSGNTMPFQGIVMGPSPTWYSNPSHILFSGECCGNVRIRMILAANYNGLIIIFLTKCARCTPITSGVPPRANWQKRIRVNFRIIISPRSGRSLNSQALVWRRRPLNNVEAARCEKAEYFLFQL